MTPDYFRDPLVTQFIPPILGFMLLGAVAGLLVKGVKSAIQRAVRSSH